MNMYTKHRQARGDNNVPKWCSASISYTIDSNTYINIFYNNIFMVCTKAKVTEPSLEKNTQHIRPSNLIGSMQTSGHHSRLVWCMISHTILSPPGAMPSLSGETQRNFGWLYSIRVLFYWYPIHIKTHTQAKKSTGGRRVNEFHNS